MVEVEAFRAAPAFLENEAGGHSRIYRNFHGLDISFPSIGRKFLSLYEPGLVSRSEQTGRRKQKKTRGRWEADNDDDNDDDDNRDDDDDDST